MDLVAGGSEGGSSGSTSGGVTSEGSSVGGGVTSEGASEGTSTSSGGSSSEGTTSEGASVGGSEGMSGGGGGSATMGTSVGSDTSTSTSTSTGDTSTGDTSTGDTSTGGDPCACSPEALALAAGIVLVDDGGALWRFSPGSLEFTVIGAIGCDGVGGPFSIAVDRGGQVWASFDPPAGDLFVVDLEDPAKCGDPGFVPGQLGVGRFGMAFAASDGPHACEELFGSTFSGIGGLKEGPGLGALVGVDTIGLGLSIVGPTTFDGAEVTGTGDGRLFLLGGVAPAKLVRVDPLSAAYLEVLPLPGVDLGEAFALAFWGGDLFVFTAKGKGAPSRVLRVDYDDSDGDGVQQVETVVAKAPLRAVSAGVSTCAPLAPL